MTQYNTNADFSTDSNGTQATADSADGNGSNITGYTVTHLTGTDGHSQTWTVTSDAGAEGGKYIDSADAGGAYLAKCLATNDLTIATGTEFDLLIKFRIPSPYSVDDSICFFHEDASGNDGYCMRFYTDGDARMYYTNGANFWAAVGAKTTPTAGALTGDTWYWLRVHRMGSADNHDWSWAIDTSIPTTVWDVGDGGTGGVSESSLVAGKVGVGNFWSGTDADFDWFSSADAGDAAPSPAAGGGIIQQASYHYLKNTGSGL